MKSRAAITLSRPLIFFGVLLMCRALAAQIVYVAEYPQDKTAGRVSRETAIHIYNPDTGEDRNITDKQKLEAYETGRYKEPITFSKFLHTSPAVSPDGRKIAYSGYRNYPDENLKKWKEWDGEACIGAGGKPLTEEMYLFGYAYITSEEFFASMRNFNWNIYIYDLNSDKEKQATFFKWDEGQPQFLKRGGAVLYALTAKKSVFVLKTAGGRRGFKQIILMDNEVLNPVLSPNGNMLVFQSYIHGNWEIYTLKLADSYKDRLKTRLTHTTGVSELFPRWIDDETVLYAANKLGQTKYNFYKMNIRTEEITQLTTEGGAGAEADYSPNTGLIVFTDFSKGRGQIAVMDVNGSEIKYLTEGKASNRLPVWSPDGASIAFISDEDGTPGLYTMSATGGGKKRAVKTQAAWEQPVWY